MFGKRKTRIGASIILALLVFAASPAAVASTPAICATAYCTEETFFGTGGELDPSSAQYKARFSVGETGVGNVVGGSSFQANVGYNTTDVPMLEFQVTGGTLDLGTLSSTSTTTGTATFSVRNYLSGGYIVTAVGNLPTSEGGATIDGMPSQAAPATNTEQFGINLVANTVPTTFGANPSQVPDSTFSFGAAATGYNTTNQYKYVRGDTIAQSTSSSGETDYTVSYIVNIRALTEAGVYSTDQVFVATGTY